MNIDFISYDDMIACARRELALRKRVYQRWIDQERMSEPRALHEIACMEAILAHLERSAGRREETLL